MLDESLENFLEVSLTGERYKLFIEIISYLESIEYETVQDELLDIMYSAISDEDDKVPKPESTICDEMHAHLGEILISQLSQLGVTAEESVTLRNLYELVVGINHIAGFEDVAGLIASASSDLDSIDQLAHILQLVTTQHHETWIPLLESVSPDLIKRVREMSNQIVEDEYQEMEASAEYLQTLRLYSAFVTLKDRSLIVLQLVGDLIMGMEFETYINSGYLNNLFEGNEMDKLALELYAFALMSSDAKNDPLGAVRLVIEKYLNDSARIVRLTSELNAVNAAFVKYKQINKPSPSNQNGQA